MLRQYKLRDYKFRLVFWVVVLSVLGVMIIGSADKSFQMKQLIGLGVGIVCMVVVSLMDYSWLINFYWIYYVLGIVLLLAVRFFGTEVNGAKRWIDLGFFRFQQEGRGRETDYEPEQHHLTQRPELVRPPVGGEIVNAGAGKFGHAAVARGQ